MEYKVGDIYYREMCVDKSTGKESLGVKVEIIKLNHGGVSYNILDIVKPNRSNCFEGFSVNSTSGFTLDIANNYGNRFIPWDEYLIKKEIESVIEGE